MRRKFEIWAGLLCILFLFIFAVYAYDLPKWFPFNQENALQEWQEKIFKDRVLYEVRPESEDGFLSAKSEGACSGLIYRIKFNAVKDPMISWYWKVKKFPKKTEVKESSGGWLEKDDYAARVYVIFPSWNFMNIKSLEYVWDESAPVESVISSPYTNNIKIIVVETGKKHWDEWVFEKRDIYKDYKRAFGRAPRSLRVGAIALMTDSDNTISTAEAFYKNIKVGYKQ